MIDTLLGAECVTISDTHNQIKDEERAVIQNRYLFLTFLVNLLFNSHAIIRYLYTRANKRELSYLAFPITDSNAAIGERIMYKDRVQRT